MIGNLGESRGTAKETFEFFKKLDPDFSGLAVAIPFPGTRFFTDAREKGLLRKENFEEFKSGTAMTDTGFLTTREVEDLASSYNKKMLAYKKSASRRIRLIKKAGRGQSLKEALWRSKNDYEQFRTGQMGFFYDRVPLRFLDYEKTFKLKYNLFLEGWYDPEKHDERYVCWSRGRAKVVLKYDPCFTTLNVKYSVGHPDSDRNPVRITVDAGSSNRRVFSVSSNEWSEFQMPLRLLEKKDRLIISLAVNRTFNPKKLGMGEDQRDLGLLVERIWLSSSRGQE
jgi:hypothetical protein